MTIDPAHDWLGVIDVQLSFMPGGELPVPDGASVVPVINRLLDAPFRRGFASQDWHPAGHVSFASQHTGRSAYDEIDLPYGRQVLWPDHAMQGSSGAAFHPSLDLGRIELIVRKGTRRDIDSYSAFLENDRVTPTGLAGALRELGARRVFFVGLAMDFCVASSAEHAVQAGFEAYVIEDGCRAIGPVEAARRRLTRCGVQVLLSGELS